MGELTTSLAHEINQPLTAILSNGQAAQRFSSRAEPDIGEVRQILVDIIRDDRRASEVVQNIRVLVKKEEPVVCVIRTDPSHWTKVQYLFPLPLPYTESSLESGLLQAGHAFNGFLGRFDLQRWGMPQGSITVYIVDDDDSVRRALERLLRSVGYSALTFESAEDFLDVASGSGEGCLILDIRLPGITGLDLQEKLASMGAKYSIIFMTAHDNPEWRERARKAGAVAYLKKPFNENSLLEAVKTACGKGATAF